MVFFSRVRMFLVSIIAKVGWDHHVQVICLCLYEPHNAVDRWGHPKYPLCLTFSLLNTQTLPEPSPLQHLLTLKLLKNDGFELWVNEWI